MPVSRPLVLKEPSAARPRVLVASGDERVRAQLADLLRAERLRVSTVDDGVALFEHLEAPPGPAARPDVIVADAELDGFSALEILAMTEARGRPPTIVVSSRIDVSLRLAARRLGVAELVTTSQPSALRKAVRTALRARRGAPRAA